MFMLSANAIPDPNPTRVQLRLIALGQWVRAGLDLVQGAAAGRGLLGGAVALWRVLQAVRLAMQLAQRLSELSDLLSRAASEPPRATPAADPTPCSDDDPGAAAWLHDALSEIARSIRDALGLVPDRRRQPRVGPAAAVAAGPEIRRACARLSPPRGRPPGPGRRRARRRRPGAPRSPQVSTPIAAPAIGRLRLAAG